MRKVLFCKVRLPRLIELSGDASHGRPRRVTAIARRPKLPENNLIF